MVIECVRGPDRMSPSVVRLLPGQVVDISPEIQITRNEHEGWRSSSRIRELIAAGGPLDPAVYGWNVPRPDGANSTLGYVRDEYRGVPIEFGT